LIELSRELTIRIFKIVWGKLAYIGAGNEKSTDPSDVGTYKGLSMNKTLSILLLANDQGGPARMQEVTLEKRLYTRTHGANHIT
jgi:hypothetical protein